MKLSKKMKTKLDLIRLEGLRKLIVGKYEEDELMVKIASVTKVEHRDAKIINKLSRTQLIKIIELSSITEDDINKCYEEYRYGLKPGFSIYSFKSDRKLSIKQVENEIKEHLNTHKGLIDEQPSIKDIKYNTYEEFKTDGLVEYSFFYLKKYSYIDENEEPSYIYELKECFVWVSIEYNFVAIKNCDERVVKNLITLINNIYETELNSIVLTKDLVRKIFGDRSKKISGVNLNASRSEAQKMTISDPNLNEKEELKRQLSSYTTTSENLEINIDDVLNTLGINNAKGKVHLTKNTTATKFRKWSVETIKKIIEYISENSNEFEIFKAQNITAGDVWNIYNKFEKQLIEEIIFKISCFKKTGKYNPLIQNKVKYSEILKSFYSKVYVECSICNDSHCIPYCDCNSHRLHLVKNGKIICMHCGETLNVLNCEEGHKIDICDLNNVNLYLVPNSDLLNKVKLYLNEKLNVEFNGYFSIYGNSITIIENSSGALVNLMEIKEFKAICEIQINQQESEKLNKQIKKIKEKCLTPTKEKCNMCNKQSDDICLLKLFTLFNGYRPGPHHGHEFGDVNFKIEYQNDILEFVGIAKSACNLTLSSKESREMIQQILWTTHDKERVDIIGAICPARFDTQLEKELEYIAKCTKSKILIMDDLFMQKLLKVYAGNLDL